MIRKMFIIFTIVALGVNFYADFHVLQQTKAAEKSGEWLNRSYEVTKAIDAARISVLESLLKKSLGPQVREKIQLLDELVNDMPPQKQRADLIQKLSNKDLLKPFFNPALLGLAEISATEEVLLQTRLKIDKDTNIAAANTTLYCNGIDIFLIFLFLAFFLYERRTAQKLHGALAKSLIDVEASSQKLQIALAQRSKKLKNTVHDLKNPLGSIRGFAELLYEDATNKDSVIEMAGIIQKVSNSTLSLVSALLENDGTVVDIIDPIDVLDCLKETCLFLSPIANQKNQKIQIDKNSVNFEINCKPQQLQDVFFNVIGNALKFSPKGSIVKVESTKNDGFFEIHIKDSGPGFSDEDFLKIFTPGAKLSAKPTGEESSTGFGLSSVKETIESLSGKISVSNNPDYGACVSIQLKADDKVQLTDNSQKAQYSTRPGGPCLF